MSFFIDRVPMGAEYCHSSKFFTKDILDSVQVVGAFWTRQDLRQICMEQPHPLHADSYRIIDVQYSPTRGEVLNSNCIFRWKIEESDTPRFGYYLQHMKDKIDLWRADEYKDQKLLFYVGCDVWDLLHKEKILQAKDIDFVRMAHSSTHSRMGQRWRALAYDRYDYPFVYMDDTDVGDSQAPLPDEVLYRRIQVLKDYPDAHFHFTIARVRDEWLKQLHFEFDSLRYRLMGILSLRMYFNTRSMRLIRGPKRLPFARIVPILSRCTERTENLTTLYDPNRNLYTQVRQLEHPNDFVADVAFWVYSLLPHIRAQYDFYDDGIEVLDGLSNNHFYRRMLNDLEDMGVHYNRRSIWGG